MQNKFLAGLKVGDEVAISGNYSITLHKIVKITPTRRFEIDNGNKYDCNGHLMGKHYNYSSIVPKEEYYKKIERDNQEEQKRELIKKIDNHRFTLMSMEKLEKILKVIEE